ncbi:Na(+)/H(+) antiporter subunit B [Rubripirellula obstinata]|uniref:Na(+)/H(+) antiporter subunit B n=1 Tax=Rubripirellula obstinata TaxID=406547 RepID=A0A5B1CHT1_9BACT|nr:Na(+)/H(+) antiporter subunit B [Rubripirellula obstinata]KAA1259130.1 Na(+)/H(+) antiporter subunit B [Rubripirellula obstinata]
MKTFPIIRVVTKILIPYILLFGCYVQFHGDYGPGGGFQAGVIFASGLILYGLVFGLDAVRTVAPPRVIEKLMSLGVLIFAGTGVLTMLLGGNFLDYDYLEHHVLPGILPTGQHLGLFLVELGVGVTVTAVMTMIFYAFAGRVQAKHVQAKQEPTP